MVLHRLPLPLVVFLAMILQACAPQLPPTIEPIPTSTFSSTPTTTEVPQLPSITPPPPQPRQESVEPITLCSPSDLELYKSAALPLLDQIVVASREATQLATLPPDRIPALVGTSVAIQEQLVDIQPPRCLQEAHNAALEGASLLVHAVESIGSADYSQAETSLRASFEMVAQAVALLTIQIWEATATSTPTV